MTAISRVGYEASLAGQFAEELALVHVVLESFAAVDEDNRDIVVELATQFGVGVDINFAPAEAAVALELREALFDDFAKMAPLPRINYYAAKAWHAA
jgi:hypothetical protein